MSIETLKIYQLKNSQHEMTKSDDLNSPQPSTADPNVFLKTFDSSGMYNYVLRQGAIGTAIGGVLTGALTWAGLRFGSIHF